VLGCTQSCQIFTVSWL